MIGAQTTAQLEPVRTYVALLFVGLVLASVICLALAFYADRRSRGY